MIEPHVFPRDVLADAPWTRAAMAPPKKIELAWSGARSANFGKLPGWKAPLWRWVEGGVELLRPQGRWRASVEGAPRDMMLFERESVGWMSRRGIEALARARQGVWFDQNGVPTRPADADVEARAPRALQGQADSSGCLARWELSDDGRALAWLDDSFEAGPLSCRPRAPWMVVSDGKRKVAYWVGPAHWAWPMMDKGLLLLVLGRGGGWEKEAVLRPIMMG